MFMSGGVAARLDDDDFVDMLYQLNANLGSDGLFVSLMCGSIDKRLDNYVVISPTPQ
jgi:hypothetical protein